MHRTRNYMKQTYYVCSTLKITNQSSTAFLVLVCHVVEFTSSDWGLVVVQLVETLRYKPEGRGFDSRLCHRNFSLTNWLRGFGGLGVECWPLVPKFAGSNPAEAVGFLRAKKSSARLPSEGK